MEAINEVVARIHATAPMFCVAVTGAGSTSLKWTLGVGGSSKTLLEGVVPYHQAALYEYIGHPVASAVRAPVAVEMARAAFERAVRFTADSSLVDQRFGVSCTASIATTRDRKGFNECYVASWGAKQLRNYHLRLEKGRDRSEEEDLVAAVVIKALADCCDIPFAIPFPLTEEDTFTSDSMPLERVLYSAQAPGPAPLLGHLPLAENEIAVIYPGSYNPLHEGHIGVVQAASRLVETLNPGKRARVIFELTAKNADKSDITQDIIQQRAAQFQGKFDLVITKLPLVVQKAQVFAGSYLVLGYDTAIRVLDKKYYGSDEKLVDSLRLIRDAGCTIIVAGRLTDSGFKTLADIAPPATMPTEQFSELFKGLTEEDFRLDLSSTALRAKASGL
eukprot:TRINITY_DN18305_c2_g3_i1.p1 TRINITY_DN18305_c2_g3~~TRINITY_DN18305_c2_g3_i1.p1  ORF type:complete len:398 (+),score=62.29 TRINITY_DN18305_c2_g3_i1:25-1194(+)